GAAAQSASAVWNSPMVPTVVSAADDGAATQKVLSRASVDAPASTHERCDTASTLAAREVVCNEMEEPPLLILILGSRCHQDPRFACSPMTPRATAGASAVSVTSA